MLNIITEINIMNQYTIGRLLFEELEESLVHRADLILQMKETGDGYSAWGTNNVKIFRLIREVETRIPDLGFIEDLMLKYQTEDDRSYIE